MPEQLSQDRDPLRGGGAHPRAAGARTAAAPQKSALVLEVPSSWALG